MILKVSHRLAKPKKFDYFNKFKLDLRYDSIGSAFSFDFRFDPQNQEHAELFAVSHFHEAIVEHNGETLVTGFILSQDFEDGPKKKISSISGYSKTGVLEDCEIPPTIYPLQVNGLSLAQIAKKICDPFRLKVVIDEATTNKANTALKIKPKKESVKSKMDKPIKSTTSKETDNIKNVLTKLALQQKIVITHNEFGDLLFTTANTKGSPIIDFVYGTIGTEFKLTFNGQGLHSHITVMKEASSDGGNAGEVTIRNPFVPVAYTYRPKVVTQGSGDDVTTIEYAKQVLKTELKNGIKLVIKTDRWEVNGKIIKPNNIVTVENPSIFLYKKTNWFVESILFEGDESKTVATLTCVLPTCYDDSDPKNIFVEHGENFPRYNYAINNGQKSSFK